MFHLAMEENRGSLFLEEAEAVSRVLSENPDFNRLMLHPAISEQEKIEVIEKVFGGRISKEMTAFLTLVTEKERYADLQDIFRYFIDRMKEEQKTGVAYVTSAAELSEEQKRKIKERLLVTAGYRTMEMHYAVDPELIGGMVIRIRDRVVDSSIRTKLNDLRKQLLQIQLA